MERTFQLFQQLRHALQGKSFAQAHGTRPHHKPADRFRPAGIQAQPQVVVYQFLESLPVAAHLLFEFGVHIVIESESRSHIQMLAWRHQDAQTAGWALTHIRRRAGGGLQEIHALTVA
jgi:hypothetical protein